MQDSSCLGLTNYIAYRIIKLPNHPVDIVNHPINNCLPNFFTFAPMKNAELSLKVKRSVTGLGLFATAPIAKGTRIIEYKGDKINLDEANRRGGMYLFEINPKWFIDGKNRQNKARYINHTCGSGANCTVDIIAGRIWIIARKNIPAGAELTYDYGREMFDAYIKPYGCKCVKCNPKAD